MCLIVALYINKNADVTAYQYADILKLYVPPPYKNVKRFFAFFSIFLSLYPICTSLSLPRIPL